MCAADIINNSFNEFINNNLERMIGYARTLTGNIEKSEDIVQIACLKIYQNWELIEKSENRLAYCKKIIKNQHIDNLRKPGDPDTLSDDHLELPASGYSVEQIVLRNLLLEQILDLANEQQRELIIYSLLGYEIKDMAAMLGISLSALRSRVRRFKLEVLPQLKELWL